MSLMMDTEEQLGLRDWEEPGCPRGTYENAEGLPSSSSVLLYVHRDHKDYYGRWAKDVHLDFLIAPELWPTYSMLLYVHRDHKDYYGRGTKDGHLDLLTAPDSKDC